MSLLAGTKRVGQPMRARKRFLLLTLIMVGACALVMAVMTAMLYRHDIKEHREKLQTTAQSQARLIEAVARYDARMADLMGFEYPDHDASAATLSQIIDAHEHYEGHGVTGEFILARHDGDFIVFIFRHQYGAIERPAPVAFDSELAEPMRRALKGLSGTVIGLDYRGETVLAAYEPVAVLNLGIVTKIDLTEIRAPFIRSGLLAAAVALLVVLAGTALFFRVGNPIIARLEAYSRDLEKEVEEHKQDKEALKKSASMLQISQMIGKIGSFEMDIKGSNVKWSDQIFDLFGMKRTIGPIDYETVLALIHPDDRERAIKVSGDAAKEGKPYELEHRVIHPDGKIFNLLIKGDVIRNEKNEIIKTGGTVQDITERKQAENALRESEEKYRSLFEYMQSGFALHEMVLDEKNNPVDYIFLDVNDAFEKQTTLKRADIIGRKVTEVLPGIENDPADWIGTYGAVVLNGKSITFENYLPTLDRWYSVVAYRPREGQFAVVFTDITERKQAEKARARLNAQLKAKNKELEQIVYVASHDLRSPLVNIDGYGKELEQMIADLRSAFDSDKTPTEALEAVAPLLAHDIPDALRFIRTSASKMDALLAGLLKLSRSGRVALTIDSLDMNELMAKVVEASEFQIKEVGAELNVAELPPCKGDAVQVNQVFSNLLGNALQYLAPERPGTIRISGRVEGERSVYCVEDNGIGIAPAHRQNIFEIFHQLDPAKGKGEGLGLTIVQQILGRLSGAIWVESKLGEGSRFYVALPAVQKNQ